MPAEFTLRPEHYNRLVCVTVPCWCGARRGEPCRGAHGRSYQIGSKTHADRLVAHNAWKKENPEQYAKLRAQIEAEIIKSAP